MEKIETMTEEEFLKKTVANGYGIKHVKDVIKSTKKMKADFEKEGIRWLSLEAELALAYNDFYQYPPPEVTTFEMPA